MLINDLVGTFHVQGNNQDIEGSTYSGTLSLSLDHNDRVIALWNIATDQIQHGKGFYRQGILVINFHYKGVDSNTYNGVVVYKCLSKNILEGFWSEEKGDPSFLGTEIATRTQPNPSKLN